jgi:UDP-N-acetylmuramoyl-L-alanyl-D-glutamate--2,6-diaminopimelate ligase
LNAVLSTPTQAADWLRLRILGTLRADSRQVQAGDGFLAWPGAATDARRFVPAVLQAGAAACLMEREGAEQLGLDLDDPRLGLYEGLRAAAAPLASAFFGEPSTRLDVLAVTGTNGKTSTAWWLAQALGLLGQRCALVGTLGIGEPGAMVANGLTTPDPVLLQSELQRLAGLGFVACALEASSIGLQERRLDGTRIRCAIFTNFTQDHLDYHGDMAAYWQAKARLFDWPQLQAAVIHIDDAQGARLPVWNLRRSPERRPVEQLIGPLFGEGLRARHDAGIARTVKAVSELTGGAATVSRLSVAAGLLADLAHEG